MRISSLKAFRPIAFKLEYVMDEISQQMTGTGVGLLWPLAIPFRRGEICKDKLFSVWRKQIHVARLHLILFFTWVPNVPPLSRNRTCLPLYKEILRGSWAIIDLFFSWSLSNDYSYVQAFRCFSSQMIQDLINMYSSWSRLSNYRTPSLGQVMKSHYCVSLWATRK